MNYFYESAGLGPINVLGQPVKRSKYEYPYSYDAHVLHRLRDNVDGMTSVYSDRMMQWDWDKFHDSCQEVFGDKGQLFNVPDRSPELIEKFLQLYFDEPELQLIAVEEGCNVSNGYPYWVFHFK